MALTTVQDEGTTISTTATTLNFIGAGVKATAAGAIVTVAIPDAYLDAVRDYGADPTGAADSAVQLQNAFNGAGGAKRPLIIPPGNYKVSSQQLLMPSNLTIFGYGAVLQNWIPSLTPTGVLALIYSGSPTTPVENVFIHGLTFDGRRSSFTLNVDKHGLKITGNVRHVRLHDCTFVNHCGDGWNTLVNAEDSDLVPVDVVVEDAVSRNNVRQGASITVGRQIVVRGGIYADTNGAAPGAGIDVEVDYTQDTILEDVLIEGVLLENNEGPGFATEFAISGANPLKRLVVRNCTVKGNGHGMFLLSVPEIIVDGCWIESNGSSGIYINGGSTNPPRNIQIRGCTIRNNPSHGILSAMSEGVNAKTIKVTDCVIYDNGSESPGSRYGMIFQGSIDDVQISGTTSQNRSTTDQAIGLVLQAGVTRSRTNMCNFQGNSLAAVVLSDDATTRKFGAENNL